MRGIAARRREDRGMHAAVSLGCSLGDAGRKAGAVVASGNSWGRDVRAVGSSNGQSFGARYLERDEAFRAAQALCAELGVGLRSKRARIWSCSCSEAMSTAAAIPAVDTNFELAVACSNLMIRSCEWTWLHGCITGKRQEEGTQRRDGISTSSLASGFHHLSSVDVSRFPALHHSTLAQGNDVASATMPRATTSRSSSTANASVSNTKKGPRMLDLAHLECSQRRRVARATSRAPPIPCVSPRRQLAIAGWRHSRTPIREARSVCTRTERAEASKKKGRMEAYGTAERARRRVEGTRSGTPSREGEGEEREAGGMWSEGKMRSKRRQRLWRDCSLSATIPSRRPTSNLRLVPTPASFTSRL
uniref:Uncharacterized protein n=1 Tax=Mycena chlorophos TaxID=658473 RepID=A0ABQ0M0S6_MYCCL|nr:predicted protein [Mycena chlorophos]